MTGSSVVENGKEDKKPAAVPDGIEYVMPQEIEKRSFSIIEEELQLRGITLPVEEAMVTKRVIHTSADFSYAQTMTYSTGAVETAKWLITEGADIVTDTNMALSGINKRVLARYGGSVHALWRTRMWQRGEGAGRYPRHREHGTGGKDRKPVIFAIGNAPTALIQLYGMIGGGLPPSVHHRRSGRVCQCGGGEGTDFTDEDTAYCKPWKKGRQQCRGCHLQCDSLRAWEVNSCAMDLRREAAPQRRKGGGLYASYRQRKARDYHHHAKGILYHARMEEISRTEHSVRCAVRKDGGDDPDITTGTLILRKYPGRSRNREKDCGKPQILITGGTGVGTVTRPGLDQPVGSAAINHVPREMITREVEEVCALTDYAGSLLVEISVQGRGTCPKDVQPETRYCGRYLNPWNDRDCGAHEQSGAPLTRSMWSLSRSAKRDTGLRQSSPGNYGLEYMKRAYGFDLDRSVKCSNFIGKTMDMAVELGFEAVLLTGHIGKLVKLSGGIMDTHSREADARMELLMVAAYRAGVPDTLGKILDCLVTEEALAYIAKDGCLSATMELLMKRFFLFKEAGERGTACGMHSLCERVRRAGEKRRCGRTSGTNPRGRRTFAVTQFKEETVWYILSGRVREQRI